MKNKILSLLVLVLIATSLPNKIEAYSENSEYVELHQGDAKEQKKNYENLMNNLEKSKEIEVTVKPKGWGETIRPGISAIKQQNNYYCGPATVYMVLNQMNGSSPSQSTLGSSMGTNKTDGTYVYKMTNELNNRQSKFTYAHQLILNQTDMKNALYTSIGNNAPAILHTYTKPLIMYNGKELGHYLVAETIVEYNVDGVLDEIGYVDPWYVDYGAGNVFGKHYDSAVNFFDSLYGRYIIWGVK